MTSHNDTEHTTDINSPNIIVIDTSELDTQDINTAGTTDKTSDKNTDTTGNSADDNITDNTGTDNVNPTYPNISKANDKRIIILGSLAAVLLIFILSILFPGSSRDNPDIDSSESSASTTEKRTTEKEIVTGWQEIDGAVRYVRADGKLARSQWVDDHYVGASGAMFTGTLTPDGIYVNADGDIDDSMGTEGSHKGLWELYRTLDEMVMTYNGTWSVYVKDIGHDEYLLINNVQQYSASMIKLYCAATAYELMDKGTLEETPVIDSLMRQMISVSDNDAFNLMVMNCGETYSHVAGRQVIQEYIDREGYKDTTITSMLVPTKYPAPSSPGRNYTTVYDCGLLLERIYKKQCVSPEASEAFLTLLLDQNHVNKIPAGLPDGTKCANKTGDTNEVQHDAAIVYSPGGDYVIAVMSSNCGAAITNIQIISKTVYDYFN